MLRIIIHIAIILMYQHVCAQAADTTLGSIRKPLEHTIQNEKNIQPLFEQTALVPLKMGITFETAEVLAKTQAMLNVLDVAAKDLRKHQSLRFQKLSIKQYTALASVLYPMKLTSTLTLRDTKEFVEAYASLYPPTAPLDESGKSDTSKESDKSDTAKESDKSDTAKESDKADKVGKRIQELLTYPTQNMLCEHTLTSLDKLLRDALEILKIPKPNTTKTNALIRHIQALTDYLQLLSKYHDKWDNAPKNLEKLTQMHEKAPNDPLIALGLAEILLQQNQVYNSQKAIDITLETLPKMAYAYYIRGLINLNLRLPSLAADDFNLAIKIQPEAAKFWRALGIALSMAGHKETMCEALYKACSLGDCEGFINARKIGFCTTSN